MKVLVKNFHSGDAVEQPKCGCSSWIDHWNKNRYPDGEKYAGYCRFCNEKFAREELFGGHVIKVNSSDKTRYIIPLCRSCNSASNEKAYFVDESDLIPAAKEKCKA